MDCKFTQLCVDLIMTVSDLPVIGEIVIWTVLSLDTVIHCINNMRYIIHSFAPQQCVYILCKTGSQCSDLTCVVRHSSGNYKVTTDSLAGGESVITNYNRARIPMWGPPQIWLVARHCPLVSTHETRVWIFCHECTYQNMPSVLHMAFYRLKLIFFQLVVYVSLLVVCWPLLICFAWCVENAPCGSYYRR